MAEESSRLARREFLTAIGRAVGGSVMLRTMLAMGLVSPLAACGSSSASPAARPVPPPPPGRPPSPRPGDWPANAGAGRSVSILGGGIAGMTAALEMGRLGYDCTILEARSLAGGRVRTLRSGDTHTESDSSQVCQFDADDELYFNPGPSRIAQHHEFLLAYCRDFGVPLEVFTNDNRGAWLHSPAAFGGEPQVARRVLADTRGGIADLLARAIDGNALDAELSAADKANVLAMLRQFGDLNGADRYTGSTRAGFPGQMDAGSRQRGQLLPARDLQSLVTEFFWEYRLSFAHGFEQQPTMLQPVGGMDRIARAFESQLASRLVTNAVVREIRKTATGCRVVYESAGTFTTLDTDYCIVTIPATVLRDIPNDFSAGHSSEIAAFQYSSAVRTAVQSRRFWEEDHNIYGGISWTDQDITQIWYPNNGFQRAQGVLLTAYAFGGGPGDRMTAMSPVQRIDSSITQASRVHPEIATEASNGISVAWRKVPFQSGAWGLSTPLTLLTPDERFYFAGEHLSILQGWQEGAILSAYSAIDGVVQRDTSG